MNTLKYRRLALAVWIATAASFSLLPLAAQAQAWPAKSIRLVAPQLPGGAVDTLARIVAQKLSERLGQPVVVDNRPGANGVIGTGEVARLPADGYTLLMASDGSHAINPALYKSLTYDSVKDFAPIAIVGRVPAVLVTGAKSPFNSVDDVVAASKKGTITYASAGNGSTNHLMATMVQSRTGADFTHVPYKGAAPALLDVVGGRIEIMWASISAVAPFVKSGQVKALAVSSGKRSPALPNVPALGESKLFPGFDATPWYGLLAPAGTPLEIVNRLNSEVSAILDLPDVRKQLETSGAYVDKVTPEEFAKVVRDDLARWAKVVKESGAVVE
ncbi:MAG: tripartite tricarboxylate transporter substrate binding protein [Ottowia sp.]|uniref:Bug family tripartite tricarboxylate transporter substrate binding protein n=1 Tax=Ottowia sp. TaxID=1898956 RepID=UPI0039E2747B